MELIFFAIVTLVFAWTYHLWNNRAYLKLAHKIPSNKLHTFLGFGVIPTPQNLLRLVSEYIEKYGPTTMFWMGPFPLFTTTDLQILSEIFKSKNCVDKPWLAYNAIVRIGGHGLVTLKDPTWSQHRRLLNKAFTPKMILSFFPIFHQEIKHTIKQIQAEVEAGRPVDLIDIFRQLTVSNATQTTLKRNLRLTSTSVTKLTSCINVCFNYVALEGFNCILFIPWMRKLAQRYIYPKAAISGLALLNEIVAEAVDIVKTKNKENDPSILSDTISILDIALKGVEQNELKMEEIQGHMVQMFLGAFDTTSTTLYIVLILLAMHPKYQEYAFEEVRSAIPDDDETEITMEQLNQLKYLEMVIYETIRLFPPITGVIRQVSNQPVQLSNGLKLDVGQIILIDIYSISRCKKLWGQNANDFNPENFLPENVASRHPFQFLAFTKGQRVCIGMKYGIVFLKMALAKIIKNFKFKTDFKYEDLIPENHLTLKLKEEPLLHVERRKS